MSVRKSDTKSKPFSVLIVCEGTNTEPAYFKKFNYFLNKNFQDLYPKGIKFTIFPYPSDDFDEILDDKQLFKRKKKKREILNSAQIINEEIEDEYLAEPTRWVRYAQKCAKGAGFDKVFSVFDYDNRPCLEIEKAFNLANNDNKEEDCDVVIGYSSYSFEYWLLMHYELYQEYLGDSECKEGKVEIQCGYPGTKNLLDCKGDKCLGGYLRVNNYEVGFYNKSEKSTFPAIEKFLTKARFNSSYIKALPRNNNLKLWEMKPVTNIDEVIDSLIISNYPIIWSFTKGKISFVEMDLKWDLNQNHIIFIQVNRKKNNTIVIQAGKIKLLDRNYVEYIVDERILITNENNYLLKEIDISQINIYPLYISVEIDHKIYISELQ